MAVSSHARNFLSLSASFLALPVLALVTSPILARVLGPEGRGAVAAVSAPISVGESVAAFGFPLAASYFVSKGVGHRAFFRRFLPFAVLSGLTTYSVLFFLSPVILRDNPVLVDLLRYAGLFVILSSVMGLLRGIRNGEADYKRLAAERWLQGLSRVILIVAFAWLGWLTVASTVWVNVLTGVLATVVLLRWHRDAASSPPPNKLQVIRYSASSWAGQVGSVLNGRLDQAVLVAFVPVRELGFYAVAATASELPAMFFLAAQKMVIGSASGIERATAVARLLRIAMPGGVLLAVLYGTTIPFLVPFIFGHEFAESVTLVLVLLVGLTSYGLAQILLGGLLAVGRPGWSSVGEVVGGFVTVAGLFLFAPAFGVIAAAWVSVASYTTVALTRMILFRRVTGLTWRQLLVMDRDDLNWLLIQVRRATRSRA